MPFIVRWPERIKAGERCATTIVFNDVLPTVAEVLDVSLDNHTAEDGQSFFPALTAKSRPGSFHEAIVHNRSDGTFAIRQGTFKLTVSGPKTTEQVLDESFPVSFTLHDLDIDMKETSNLAANYPRMVKQMHALLRKYVRQGRSDGR